MKVKSMKNRTKKITLILILSVFLVLPLLVWYIFIWNEPVNVGARKAERLFQAHKQEQLSALADNQSKWDKQNITNYFMNVEVISTSSNGGPPDSQHDNCIITIEFRSGAAVNVPENTCGERDYTLGDWENTPWLQLFPDLTAPPNMGKIFSKMKTVLAERWCGPNGCNCDGFYMYSVAYHPMLGYPQHINFLYEPQYRPSTMSNPLLGNTFCTMAGSLISFLEYNISVTPVP
jgi:hypothetical protein